MFDTGRDGGKGKLGRVDHDDNQALLPVFFIKIIQMGEGPYAIDAGIVPEIEKDNLSAKFRRV
jgi:hypothetical protein